MPAIDSGSTNTCGARHTSPATGWPAPAYSSAIEAPSLCPISKRPFDPERGEQRRQHDVGLVVHVGRRRAASRPEHLRRTRGERRSGPTAHRSPARPRRGSRATDRSSRALRAGRRASAGRIAGDDTRTRVDRRRPRRITDQPRCMLPRAGWTRSPRAFLRRRGAIAATLAQCPNLIERFKAGDPDATREIYREHAGAVHTVARSIVRDPISPPTSCSRRSSRRGARPRRFEGTRELAPWLYSIARHAAVDLLRSEPKPTRGGHEPETDVGEQRETFERTWERFEVRRAIDALPEVERDVVRRSHLQGFTHQQIAEQLHISVGTVKSRSSARAQASRGGARASLREPKRRRSRSEGRATVMTDHLDSVDEPSAAEMATIDTLLSRPDVWDIPPPDLEARIVTVIGTVAVTTARPVLPLVHDKRQERRERRDQRRQRAGRSTGGGWHRRRVLRDRRRVGGVVRSAERQRRGAPDTEIALAGTDAAPNASATGSSRRRLPGSRSCSTSTAWPRAPTATSTRRGSATE